MQYLLPIQSLPAHPANKLRVLAWRRSISFSLRKSASPRFELLLYLFKTPIPELKLRASISAIFERHLALLKGRELLSGLRPRFLSSLTQRSRTHRCRTHWLDSVAFVGLGLNLRSCEVDSFAFVEPYLPLEAANPTQGHLLLRGEARFRVKPFFLGPSYFHCICRQW